MESEGQRLVGEDWRGIPETGLALARKAKIAGCTLEKTIEMFDQSYQENIPKDENVKHTVDEFLSKLKEKIRERWDSW